MKARVKETGEIVSVQLVEKKYSYGGRWIFFYEDGEGRRYADNELDFDNTDNSPDDYWTRLEHTYAGMAMQGLCANPIFMKDHEGDFQVNEDMVAVYAYDIALALVKKMKEVK